jgi:hypothetical protein
MMMIADLQISATHCHYQNGARAGFFVVMSSRKVITIDEGQVDRRRLIFLVKKEEGILRKLLKG